MKSNKSIYTYILYQVVWRLNNYFSFWKWWIYTIPVIWNLREKAPLKPHNELRDQEM